MEVAVEVYSGMACLFGFWLFSGRRMPKFLFLMSVQLKSTHLISLTGRRGTGQLLHTTKKQKLKLVLQSRLIQVSCTE